MAQSLGKTVWQLLINLIIHYPETQQSQSQVFTQVSWRCMFPQRHVLECLIVSLCIISKTWKQTKYLLNWWMDKHTNNHHCSGVLVSNKKEWAGDLYNKMNKSQINYANCKSSKRYILYPIYMTLEDRKISREKETVTARGRARVGNDCKRETGSLRWRNGSTFLLCWYYRSLCQIWWFMSKMLVL